MLLHIIRASLLLLLLPPVTTQWSLGASDLDELVDLGRATAADGMPNVAKCATSNFPRPAKEHVSEASVLVRIAVDREGVVRQAKALKVKILNPRDVENKKYFERLFVKAGEKAFLKKECPIYKEKGVPKGYIMEVPLIYKLAD